MIYLDHNASSPLLPEVAEAMARAYQAGYGNPSSLHAAGRAARELVEEARELVAARLDARPGEIIFTSGGTEADALAILGAAGAASGPGHAVCSAIEHPAALGAFRRLASLGWEVDYANPDGEGLVRPEALAAKLRPDTALVSVMAANNEVGTLQPVADLAAAIRARAPRALFHCDAVQALGKVAEMLPAAWGIDLASLSAHKIGGPKGAGALYVRRGLALAPVLPGGPQERGLRAGTENVAAIAGFGRAVRALDPAAPRAWAALRDSLERELLARIPGAEVNGAGAPRLANTCSLHIPGARADLMVMALDLRGVCVSAGSACASGSLEPSHVLLAMGKGGAAASASLRFSLGPGNSEAEVLEAAGLAAGAAAEVRAAGA